MDFFLAGLSAFKRLPPAKLEELSSRLQSRTYGKGQPVFEEGDPAEAVFVLKSGIVKAVKYSPRLDPSSMEVIAPGQLFGMIAVMDDKPYPVSAVPLQPSEAYRIPADLFRSLLDGYPDFSKSVFASVGDHLRQAQALRALTGGPVERRVAHVLGVLASSIGRDIPIRREEIAELSGCTTSTAIRTLTSFRRRGWVASGWKRITVLKPAALRRLAEKP